MTLQRHQLDDPTISAVSYDAQTEDLCIEFADGGEEIIHKAPRYLFLGLISARSATKFFYDIIQSERFANSMQQAEKNPPS